MKQQYGDLAEGMYAGCISAQPGEGEIETLFVTAKIIKSNALNSFCIFVSGR